MKHTQSLQCALFDSITTREGCAPDIHETAAFNAQTRMQVYQTAYRARLSNALIEDYPKCQVLLGADAFERMAHTYITAHPSHYYNLRYFGQHLPYFLKHTAPFSAHTILYEMALFEWALSTCLDGVDAYTVDASMLIQLAHNSDWPNTILQLHPASAVLTFSSNVLPLWQAIEKETAPMPVTALEVPIDVLIWRQANMAHYQSLDEVEMSVVKAMCERCTIAQISERLLSCMPEQAVHIALATLLKQWAQAELLTTQDLNI